ncbi:MAG: helix-hairpin-helix domain-containing protein [Pseudomonadota bacterium]
MGLQSIPGIGPKLEKELKLLGYESAEQLAGEDPERMYQRLMQLRGRHIDRCVLYAFRCAVYFASNTVHQPEKLKWWYWKD